MSPWYIQSSSINTVIETHCSFATYKIADYLNVLIYSTLYAKSKLPSWSVRADCSYSHVRQCLRALMVPGPAHRLANAALLSTVPEHGTNYRQLPDCQNCHYLHSSARWRPTSSSTSVLVAVVSRTYHHPALLWVWHWPQMCRLDSTQSI